jgi:hypothetical protein
LDGFAAFIGATAAAKPNVEGGKHRTFATSIWANNVRAVVLVNVKIQLNALLQAH